MTTSLHEPGPGRTQVPVSMRALLQRINRALAKDGEVLKTLRGSRYENDLGRYYSVDLVRGSIAARHVDPEVWGREMGVLAAWEAVRAED